jgi:hypothetical protein
MMKRKSLIRLLAIIAVLGMALTAIAPAFG